MSDIVIGGITYPASRKVAFPGSDGNEVIFTLPADAEAVLNSTSKLPPQTKVVHAAIQERIVAEAELRAEDALLETRIDELVAPSGEAPSAAEVTDARIGFDDTVYPSLGAAVRGQVSVVKTDLDDLEECVGGITAFNFTKPASGNAVLNAQCEIKAGESFRFYWTGESAVPQDSLNLYSRNTSSGTNLETLFTNAHPNTICTVTPTIDASWIRIVGTKSGTLYLFKTGTLYDDVIQLRADVDFTDTSLTLSGKAADAKAAGDRIRALEERVGEISAFSFVEPVSGNAALNAQYEIKAGNSYRFYWTGESAVPQDSLNLFSRQTSTGANLETLGMTLHPDTLYTITPTLDASWIRIVCTASGTAYLYQADTLYDDVNQLRTDVDDIGNTLFTTETPFVRFDFVPDMFDPSDILDGGGEIGVISQWGSNADALNKVHAAFDALCAANGAGYGYGERITGLYKESSSDEAQFDILAPDYVTQGVTQGDTVALNIGTDSNENAVTYNYTYESSTSPYEVRLYRFHDTNNALHTNTKDIPKKKILLIGGTHGNEFCAPVNLYVLAKQLCTDYTNPDILKLRSSFDVYIVPYLNGFGCQYQWASGNTPVTGARCNGHMVDINRNCYTAGWVGASGTAEEITAYFESKITNLATNTFPGPSNGSEFESQLVKALIEWIQPDVFIDHHHNSGNSPFYTTCRGKYAGNLIYQAANDTAYARIRNMPQYFGTKYNLFLGSDVSPVTQSAANGHMDTMAYELGVRMNAVQEMPESIAYLNGVWDSATKTATKYSAIAFKQALYTLLNVILHLGQYAMEH